MQTIFHFQAAEENYKSLIHCTSQITGNGYSCWNMAGLLFLLL